MLFRCSSARIIASIVLISSTYTKKHLSIAFSTKIMSATTVNAFTSAKVYLFPMFNDNYGYLLTDGKSNRAACVDPGDGERVYEWAQKLGLDLTTIICTHKHMDHVGGNEFLKSVIPSINVIGTKYEPIPALTTGVGEGDVFFFESLKFTTLYTPCHTAGHVVYLVEEQGAESGETPLLFSGDTLFVGGCGRFFEGTPEQMLTNMDRFATLPPKTLIFCAHEYTMGNFKFLASVASDRCGARLAEIEEKRANSIPTIPSTIEDEVHFNLFMNCRDPSVQAAVGEEDAVETMAKLREMKNRF